MDERSERELREKLDRLRQQHTQPRHGHAAGGGVGAGAGSEEAAARAGERHILDNPYVFVFIVVAILVLAVFLRVGMLKYTGFFEPDGFFHYSVIRASITNGYIVPMYLNISGFPAPNRITEPEGFYYVTIIPYAFLRYLGASFYAIERDIPVLFGLLDAIGAYLLVRHLAKSRVLGLLAMFLLAISSGDIARTAALVYRGDGFVTIFLIITLLLFLRSARHNRKRLSYVYAALSGFTLSVALIVWGGAPFAVVIFIVALILVMLYGFIKADRAVLHNSIALALGLLLMYTLERLYIYLSILRYVPALGSVHFFIFYIPILAGGLAAYYIVGRKDSSMFSIAGTAQRRTGFALLVMAAVVVAIVVALPGYIQKLSVSAIGVGSLGTTIQELQPPTWAFIWSSFSWQILLAPIGVACFLLMRRRLRHQSGSTTHTSLAFLALLAYFGASTYLQLGAIRYNSIVSVPIAIFSAYAIYSITSVLYRKVKPVAAVLLVGIEAAAFYAAFLLNLGMQLSAVTAFVLFLFAAIAYAAAYERREWFRATLFMLSIGIFAVLLLTNLTQTAIQSYTSIQADGINPQFLQAMSWMRNNTPSNATVLALWPDGSVVEGWANRTSLMDSVGGQSNPRIINFSDWLFETSPNPAYLYSVDRPQYLVVRNFWLAELGGIAIEGNVTNASAYGYDLMTSLRIGRTANSTQYLFNSSTYPYYSTELVATQGANGTSRFAAYLGSAQQRGVVPLRNVLFVNQSSGGYTMATSNVPGAANYTLMIDFQSTVITGGALLGPKMPESNLFKLMVLCSASSCPYNNGTNATMQLVYRNNDTKIFKINYQ